MAISETTHSAQTKWPCKTAKHRKS